VQHRKQQPQQRRVLGGNVAGKTGQLVGITQNVRQREQVRAAVDPQYRQPRLGGEVKRRCGREVSAQ
jgi:hypothetical protein